MILTADLHLTDVPLEDYRWRVFDKLLEFVEETNDKDVYILGDLGDRKDRHSSELVNRMLGAFCRLGSAGCRVTCILGNHDAPLKGTPYWYMLNHMPMNLKFHIKPVIKRGILLLPYSPNPTEDWKDVLEGDYNAVFMHQPVDGARLEAGTRYEGATPLPAFDDVLVWSGDIHTPQKVGKVRYVGAPHPIKFGDHYKTRLIQLDDDFGLVTEYIIDGLRRHVFEVSSVAELAKKDTNHGDQVKVRFSVDADKLKYWPAEREEISAWAQKNKLHVFAIEPHVALSKTTSKVTGTMSNNPKEALSAFATAEGLSDRIVEVGASLLDRAVRQ